MNRVRWILSVTFLLIVLVGCPVASASELAPATEALSEPERAAMVSNLAITPLDSAPRKLAIQCFDVKEDGMVVIGTGNGETKTVAVYDGSGLFRYGFTLRDSGSFGVQWNGESISVYSVRGDVVLDVMPDGQIGNVAKLANTGENNAYWNHVIFAKARTVGDRHYVLRNRMGVLNVLATSYSQLVCIDSQGIETILYDVSMDQLVKIIFLLLTACLIGGITGSVVYHHVRQSPHRETRQT